MGGFLIAPRMAASALNTPREDMVVVLALVCCTPRIAMHLPPDARPAAQAGAQTQCRRDAGAERNGGERARMPAHMRGLDHHHDAQRLQPGLQQCGGQNRFPTPENISS